MEVIERLNKRVNDYKRMAVLDGAELNLILKDITGYLYYLETVRSDVHNQYERFVATKIDEGNSVARAINMANVEFPEMYKLRRLMDGAYEVVGAIRTNISFIKSELHNINQ
jgi:hydrogenase maturation factor